MSDPALALTLTVRNATRLANGSPLTLVLDRRSATIGRASSTDWSLPDPELHISSRHCDVLFRNGGYELVDNSTNGTFVNGAGGRINGPHRLASGDVITIGHYEVVATLAASSGSGPAPAPARRVTSTPKPPVAAPRPEPAPAPTPSPAPVASDDDIWNRFAASNAIDWERGGFGGAAQPAPAPTPSASEPATPAAPVAATSPESIDPAPTPVAPPQASSGGAGIAPFLAGAGLAPEAIRQGEADALGQAGMLLRKLIAGMVVMLEARARAKSQMGAASTGLEIAGNNPLKFARSPDQALGHILNPPERGFMPAEKAIEDGFRDLQAHQLATLRAMQGALRSTLDRFSPKSIRSRAETRGLLEKILPSARDAAMWKAYEKEFSGVAFDSDEAFMDMFAKEFRKAYDEISRGG